VRESETDDPASEEARVRRWWQRRAMLEAAQQVIAEDQGERASCVGQQFDLLIGPIRGEQMDQDPAAWRRPFVTVSLLRCRAAHLPDLCTRMIPYSGVSLPA